MSLRTLSVKSRVEAVGSPKPRQLSQHCELVALTIATELVEGRPAHRFIQQRHLAAELDLVLDLG
ncbi:MAG TPA: hypothetical protein VHP33_33110 [Polyangiaceae bacterium]|nr:hypothetical protein [Polyangiaceae bacterium]